MRLLGSGIRTRGFGQLMVLDSDANRTLMGEAHAIAHSLLDAAGWVLPTPASLILIWSVLLLLNNTPSDPFPPKMSWNFQSTYNQDLFL